MVCFQSNLIGAGPSSFIANLLARRRPSARTPSCGSLWFDQVVASNSAAAGLASRRLLQIEAATRRNPRHPDFEGLDGILDTALDERGAAIVPNFSEWIGKQQQSEAAVLKAGRQWREEQATLREHEAGSSNKGKKADE